MELENHPNCAKGLLQNHALIPSLLGFYSANEVTQPVSLKIRLVCWLFVVVVMSI